MRSSSMANFSMVVLVAMLLALGLWDVKNADALLSDSECKEERRVGLNACKQVIYGRNPSPECCYRVRVSHVECVCPVVTPKLAALVDLPKAIRLIQGCGRPVPRHFKCGSLTTP